jgi:hypothetical protein
MKFLFDAGSMVHVIKNCEEEKLLSLLSDSCVLDLTKYEVGERTLERACAAQGHGGKRVH